MDRNKPRLYSLRLWIAKRRRHLNQWILRRLFSCLEKLTKRQLSLLSQRERLQSNLSQITEIPSQQFNQWQYQANRLNLQFPIATVDQMKLEDLQLISREMIMLLSDRV